MVSPFGLWPTYMGHANRVFTKQNNGLAILSLTFDCSDSPSVSASSQVAICKLPAGTFPENSGDRTTVGIPLVCYYGHPEQLSEAHIGEDGTIYAVSPSGSFNNSRPINIFGIYKI